MRVDQPLQRVRSEHSFRETGASGNDLVKCRTGGRLVHPVRLVTTSEMAEEIVRGNTVALAGMAAIDAIVPPLDDGKLAPSCDEQMSATTFLDNADGHILCPLQA